jgi:hypothetical protein
MFVQLASYSLLQVQDYFNNKLFPVNGSGRVYGDYSFVPVLPLFDNASQEVKKKGTRISKANPLVSLSESLDPDEPSVVLSVNDANLFLEEQVSSLQSNIASYRFSSSDLLTTSEANVVLISFSFQRICQHFADGVDYVVRICWNEM